MSGAERPRRAEGALLHEVTSEREGERYVLERAGEFTELPLGERDAFVWARLDGTRDLQTLASEYLAEQGALHPDLEGLLEGLRSRGLLVGDGVPLPPRAAQSIGERLTSLAVAAAVIRLPIPGAHAPWSLIGRLAAPLYRPPVLGFLALLSALAGLVLVFGPARVLTEKGPPLLEWPVALGSSLGWGILSLLLLNIVVDKLEAVGQSALLRCGGRAPRQVGVSFDLGVPGIYLDLSDATLLPLELRLRFFLVPLLTSAGVAGLATLGFASASGLFGAPLPGLNEPWVWVLLHKLAWVAWLRALVQLNPLSSSPVYEAFSAWFGIARLRREGWRLLRGGFDLDGVAGLSPRERAVLLYLIALVLYGLGAAMLGLELLQTQVLPAWRLAAATDPSRAAVLALAFLIVAVPTLLAALGGSLVLLGASVEALGQSELFATPARQALVLGVAALALGALPLVAGWPPDSLPSILGWFLAAFLALACAGAGARLAWESGRGWGALSGDALALLGVSLFAWLGLRALIELRPVLGGAHPLRSALVAASLAVGLLSASWALLELFRSAGLGARLLAVAASLAAFVLPVALANRVEGGLIFGSGVAALVAAGLALLAAVQARASQRPLPLILAGAGLFAWGGATVEAAATHSLSDGFVSYLPGGFHLPLLTSALLAAATWTLSQAATRTPSLGSAEELCGAEPLAPGAGTRWALVAFARGIEPLLGVGPAQASVRVLERHGLELEGGVLSDRASNDPDPLPRRAARALVDLYHDLAARGGDALAERLLQALAERLPARAHEELAGGAAALLPPLSVMRDLPRAERVALLAQVVQFSDFSPAQRGELADRLGVRLAEPGEVLIRQGEIGGTFYVLVSGVARVVVEDASGDERTVARFGAGDAFGEAALIRFEPRSATVWIESAALLLTLERESFAAFLRAHPELLPRVFDRQADLALVREAAIFADLSGGQVTALCRRFSPRPVEAGEVVITMGEVGDRFYLVREGEFEVRIETGPVATLRRGETFGEIALLRDVPRTASVIALCAGELLSLEREDFQSLLSRDGAETRLARLSARRLEALEEAAEAEDLEESDELEADEPDEPEAPGEPESDESDEPDQPDDQPDEPQEGAEPAAPEGASQPDSAPEDSQPQPGPGGAS